VDRSAVASEVLARICRWELDHSEAVWLHAAAVTNGDATVLLIGRSGAGKSTTAAQLCVQGFDLINDEQVALSRDSFGVASFTRPLLLKPGAGRWLEQARRSVREEPSGLIRARELGVGHVLRSQPTHVFFLEQSEEDALLELGPTAAAFRLSENALTLDRNTRPSFEEIGWLAASTQSHVVRYHSSVEASQRIISAALRPPQQRSAWKVTTPQEIEIRTGYAPRSDAIWVGFADGLLVHMKNSRTLLHLNEGGAAEWEHLVAHGAPLPNRSDDSLLELLDSARVIDHITPFRAARRRSISQFVSNI
jgi:hypothetical protein